MRKIIYIACVNLLSVNLERQALIIIIILCGFQIFERNKKPYKCEEFNKYALDSMLILIMTYFLKLFSHSINNSLFEIITSFLILILNGIFLFETVIRFIKMNGKIIKMYASSLLLRKSILY